MKNSGAGENHPYASALSKAGENIPTEVFQAIYKLVLDEKSGNLIINFQQGRISSMKTEVYTQLRKK